ncbi:NAD(P)-binding protein [Dichomitus squalens LYAD-421 SS1]|uniref:NAD(P)-binding protein n=1 Tax=Dichomitus squalens (strain LYAD-421) TaxID=732165 RepID=UPI0004411AD4|nr:NAD(P)-binding protein [Dichomitus squalens LYAD-421 SS1]EJF65174.1 NAD(P)-binding protein [Dichomitus squalens LYAD-421 SS1]
MSSAEEFRKRTLARLDSIRSHLQTVPRTSRLKGKVCIITGVGSLKGIGRATALLFAHEGARHLYLADYDPTNLPELKSTIGKAYPDVKVTVQQADAADEAAVAGLCKQALHDEGRLDVFFANAGIAPFALIEDLEAKQFIETMRVNSLSCLLAVKHASAAMKQTNPSRGKEYSGGSIILTASVAGLRSGAGSTDYSASKAAVNSIAQTAVYQLQRTDIRVNTICPGLIETGMTVGVFEPARARGNEGKIGQLNPLGRYGLPQEIAYVALFLASDESSYVNGQAWAVDGGLSSSHPVVPGRFH